jgi:hypothetical protein
LHSTDPFPDGATVASRAQPSSMPPGAPGAVLSCFLLLLAVLHPVQDIPSWPLAPTLPPSSCPPAGLCTSSCAARWARSSPVPGHPTSRASRSGLLSTGCRWHNVPPGQPWRDQAPAHVGSGVSATSTCALAGLSSQVSCVSLGSRSGRATHPWLCVAEQLSLGFPPQACHAGAQARETLHRCSCVTHCMGYRYALLKGARCQKRERSGRWRQSDADPCEPGQRGACSQPNEQVYCSRRGGLDLHVCEARWRCMTAIMSRVFPRIWSMMSYGNRFVGQRQIRLDSNDHASGYSLIRAMVRWTSSANSSPSPSRCAL